MLASTLLTLGLAALTAALPPVPKNVTLPHQHPHDLVNTKSGVKHGNYSSKIHNHLPLAPIRWHAPKEMGNISFEGTHHEIMAKIAALKPWWLNGTEHSNSSALAKRQYANYQPPPPHPPLLRTQLLCDNGFQRGTSDPAWVDIEYIRTHFGPGMCEAMPHSCGRFSCNWDTALLMCNDQNVPAIIPCSDLYWNGMAIWNACNERWWKTIEGQAFYINPSYNVLIKHTDKGKSC